MHNYHADLVWIANIVLGCVITVLTFLIAIYAAAGEYKRYRRKVSLADIKKKLAEFILSEEKKGPKTCARISGKMTLRQFLDVQTNRNREAAFFNEREQKVARECFLDTKLMGHIEAAAKMPWDKWRRVEALIALGYIRSEAGLAILKKSITDTDGDISYFSIIALGQIKSAPAGVILLDFFKKNVPYRSKIASVLDGFPREVGDETVKLADEADKELRRWAAALTSRFPSEARLKKIEKLTTDESPEVRAAACECLGRSRHKEYKDTLARSLKDESWAVRAASVNALAELMGDAAMPLIMPLVNDGSLSVINNLKDAMISRIEAALPYIEGFLEGSDGLAKRVSIEALSVSGKTVSLMEKAVHGKDKESQLCRRLLEGMVRAGAHSGLEAALGEIDEDSRKKVLDIIKAADSEMALHLEKKLAGEAEEP